MVEAKGTIGNNTIKVNTEETRGDIAAATPRTLYRTTEKMVCIISPTSGREVLLAGLQEDAGSNTNATGICKCKSMRVCSCNILNETKPSSSPKESGRKLSDSGKKDDKYGLLSGKDVLIKRLLNKNPARQRFDSADYFKQALSCDHDNQNHAGKEVTKTETCLQSSANIESKYGNISGTKVLVDRLMPPSKPIRIDTADCYSIEKHGDQETASVSNPPVCTVKSQMNAKCSENKSLMAQMHKNNWMRNGSGDLSLAEIANKLAPVPGDMPSKQPAERTVIPKEDNKYQNISGSKVLINRLLHKKKSQRFDSADYFKVKHHDSVQEATTPEPLNSPTSTQDDNVDKCKYGNISGSKAIVDHALRKRTVKFDSADYFSEMSKVQVKNEEDRLRRALREDTAVCGNEQ